MNLSIRFRHWGNVDISTPRTFGTSVQGGLLELHVLQQAARVLQSLRVRLQVLHLPRGKGREGKGRGRGVGEGEKEGEGEGAPKVTPRA